MSTCTQCGGEFTPKHKRSSKNPQRFCSRACSNQRHRVDPSLKVGKYDSFTLPEPCAIGPKGISVPLSRWVLFQKIGDGLHRCHWCQTEVRWRYGLRNAPNTLVCDHVDGDRMHNDPSNLVPSCHRCNIWRARPERIADDEPFVVNSNGYRQRAVQMVCEVCGKGFLKRKSAVARTKHDACSRRCAAVVNADHLRSLHDSIQRN